MAEAETAHPENSSSTPNSEIDEKGSVCPDNPYLVHLEGTDITEEEAPLPEAQKPLPDDEALKSDKHSIDKTLKLKDVKKHKSNTPVLDVLLTIMLVLTLIGVFCKFVDDGRFMEIESKEQYVDYSEFLGAIEKGNVYAVYIVSDSGYKIRYQLRQDVDTEYLYVDPGTVSVWALDKEKWYYTNFVLYDAFVEETQTHNVPILQERFDTMLGNYVNLLLKFGSLALPIAMITVLLISLQRMGGMGNEQRFEMTDKSGVRFDDVIGHDEILVDIKNYLVLLKNHKKINEANLKPPKGILFTGPPGTGKTLIAKAMAGEAGLPFIYLNASNAIEMFVGVGAKTIRSVFKQARKSSPCVVFIDELDAIGAKRGKQFGSSEDTQTLLALLQELDGFKNSNGILVIAATNDPKSLDPALTRAGRFDREIVINPPRTAAARYDMLKHYADKIGYKDDVVLHEFARQLSPGTTGADIAGIVNEAGLLAVMRETPITLDILNEALDKTLLKGNRVKRKAKDIDEDQLLVLYHEAGHAVMSYLEGEPITRVTVTGTTSGVGGFVMNGDSNSQFMTQDYLNKRLRILYAGECSERIKFGDAKVTNGASSDIEQATNVVMSMGLQYGMIPALGKLNYVAARDTGFQLTTEMLQSLTDYSREREDEARAKLEQAYGLVELLVERLKEQDTLNGEDVERIFNSDAAKAVLTEAHKE